MTKQKNSTRSERGEKSISRQGKSSLRATHRGNFKEDFGVNVDCYVLDDEHKTAVISQRGMASAIGLSQGGTRFIRFTGSNVLAPYIGPELRKKIENPIKFQWVSPGPQQPPGDINGYDVTILIDICKSIIQADDEGKLLARQKPFAKQARIIVNASAKSGIKGLVYALTGYDATREEVITAFKLYVQEEAREYETEFPNQLYTEWYRLYQLPKPIRNKPWKFKHLTVDQVYMPLARSNGKILELTKAQRTKKQESGRRLHQFLSEIGVKALRIHLGQLLGIAQVSESKQEYEKNVNKVFGTQTELPDID